MPDAILVLNAGSSSIKFGLFQISTDCEPALLCKGLFDEHAAEPRLIIRDPSGTFSMTSIGRPPTRTTNLCSSIFSIGSMPVLPVAAFWRSDIVSFTAARISWLRCFSLVRSSTPCMH